MVLLKIVNSFWTKMCILPFPFKSSCSRDDQLVKYEEWNGEWRRGGEKVKGDKTNWMVCPLLSSLLSMFPLHQLFEVWKIFQKEHKVKLNRFKYTWCLLFLTWSDDQSVRRWRRVQKEWKRSEERKEGVSFRSITRSLVKTPFHPFLHLFEMKNYSFSSSVLLLLLLILFSLLPFSCNPTSSLKFKGSERKRESKWPPDLSTLTFNLYLYEAF